MFPTCLGALSGVNSIVHAVTGTTHYTPESSPLLKRKAQHYSMRPTTKVTTTAAVIPPNDMQHESTHQPQIVVEDVGEKKLSSPDIARRLDELQRQMNKLEVKVGADMATILELLRKQPYISYAAPPPPPLLANRMRQPRAHIPRGMWSAPGPSPTSPPTDFQQREQHPVTSRTTSTSDSVTGSSVEGVRRSAAMLQDVSSPSDADGHTDGGSPLRRHRHPETLLLSSMSDVSIDSQTSIHIDDPETPPFLQKGSASPKPSPSPVEAAQWQSSGAQTTEFPAVHSSPKSDMPKVRNTDV